MRAIRSFTAAPASDRASITVLSLLVLVILTLIGIGVLTTSTSDLEAIRNIDNYRANFARAEAAVKAGMMALSTTDPDDIKKCNPGWLHKDYVNDDINEATNWTVANSAQAIDLNCRYTAIEVKRSGGGLNKVDIRDYAIYGRSTTAAGGEVIIRVGYRIKFIPVSQ